MDSIVAGRDYVTALSARRSDRRIRAAFQHLALSLAGTQRHFFDFGCGPGIDALEYARQGMRVDAYDVDTRMCEYFRESARDWIDRDRIRVDCRAYAEFLVARGDGAIDLVTSNFAPLNLAGDPPALFARFHSLTARGGRVLASVLNPWYLGDARYSWWWRHRGALRECGEFGVRGAQAVVMRRTPRRFAQLAAPWFTLAAVYTDRGTPARALTRATSKFLFLVFERCEQPT